MCLYSCFPVYLFFFFNFKFVLLNCRVRLKRITKKLGGSIKKCLLLDDDTTHMVTDETTYHKEIAMACCRGLWILKPEWVFFSATLLNYR